MYHSVRFGTIVRGSHSDILWVFCFLFIKPTLAIDFGGGVLVSLQFTVKLIGLLIIVFYHIFNRPNPETTKLSLTTDVTMVWLSLILFYPFNPPPNLSTAVERPGQGEPWASSRLSAAWVCRVVGTILRDEIA